MLPRRVAIQLSLVTAAAIAGCGGGGSGGGSSNPAPQNLEAAQAPSQPLTTPSTTLMATDSSGNTYSVTYSSSPGGMAMFNGQNASTTPFSATVNAMALVLAFWPLNIAMPPGLLL